MTNKCAGRKWCGGKGGSSLCGRHAPRDDSGRQLAMFRRGGGCRRDADCLHLWFFTPSSGESCHQTPSLVSTSAILRHVPCRVRGREARAELGSCVCLCACTEWGEGQQTVTLLISFSRQPVGYLWQCRLLTRFWTPSLLLRSRVNGVGC